MATKFEICHLNFAITFQALKIGIVIKTIHIYIITAILEVLMNDLKCSNFFVYKNSVTVINYLNNYLCNL